MAHESETNKNLSQDNKKTTQADFADEGQIEKKSFKNKTPIKDPKTADDVEEYEMEENEDKSEDKKADNQNDEKDNPYHDLEMEEESDNQPYNDFRH